MPRRKRLKLYEYVRELVDAGVEVLGAELPTMPADQASAVMLKIAQAVCFKNASSTVYIPEAANLANLQRNARIWAEYQLDNPEPPYTKKFTPQRIWELAGKYDLTPQMIYNVVRDALDVEVNERQAQLEV